MFVEIGENGVESALFAVDFVDEAVVHDLVAGQAFGGSANLLGIIDANVTGGEQEHEDQGKAGDQDP